MILFCSGNGNEYKCAFTNHPMHMIMFATKGEYDEFFDIKFKKQ